MNAWRVLIVAAVGVFLYRPVAQARDPQTYPLAEAVQPGDCFRVRLDMSLDGEMTVQRGDKPAKLPLKAAAAHEYPERVLSVGKDVPKTMIDNLDLTFAFKDGKLTVKGANGTKEGTYKVDSSKTPREMDLHIEGEKDDAKAIYELDKETLKIALSKKERPKDFKGGPDVAVFTFERVK